MPKQQGTDRSADVDAITCPRLLAFDYLPSISIFRFSFSFIFRVVGSGLV